MGFKQNDLNADERWEALVSLLIQKDVITDKELRLALDVVAEKKTATFIRRDEK